MFDISLRPPLLSSPEKKIHHVFALQRSGHHAVMGWLQDCYHKAGKSTGHINDAYHGHVAGVNVTDPSAGDIVRFSQGNDVTFVNYEDLGYQARVDAASYRGVHDGASPESSADIIVLRDWYNMAASRLQSIDKAERTGVRLQLHDLPWSQLTKTWEEYAGLTVSGRGPIVINYNSWFANREYRQATAARFGLANSDSALDQVPTFGRGSSFDGMAYTGAGRKMGVLERWKHLSPERFAFLIDVTESSVALDSLHTHIFGFGQKHIKQHYTAHQRHL